MCSSSCFDIHYSDWGYRRDRNSGNCTILDPKCGTESDCLTGYVRNVFNLNTYHSSDQFHYL